MDSAIHLLNNWCHLYNNTSYSATSSCVQRPFIMLTLVISVNPASNNPAHNAKQSFRTWNLKASMKKLNPKNHCNGSESFLIASITRSNSTSEGTGYTLLFTIACFYFKFLQKARAKLLRGGSPICQWRPGVELKTALL